MRRCIAFFAAIVASTTNVHAFDPANSTRDQYVASLAGKGAVGTGGPVSSYDPARNSRDRHLAELSSRTTAVATNDSGAAVVYAPSLDPFASQGDY
ncbi:hypothetical protein [Chthonobacter rhizosphaerae]|uniref:hypothetical protein n=1 Tax=Chthonobacter rhizosphaerae TaxID=2735553 RepID=UPI0015EF87A4|nr:hypothetical protein [Chthonobacter rhizosphaerae]